MAAMARCRLGVSGLLVCFSLYPAGQAWANDAAAAEALFNDGRALMEKGETERACDKFAESQRLDPSPGTSLNLASCYEKLGRTASAWAEYQVAERMATTQGRTAIADEARRKAENLGASLGTLNVEVTEPIDGLEVQLGDTKLAAAALGSKLPVDPGSYTLRVTAPGYHPHEVSVTIQDGEASNVTIPKLTPESEPAVPQEEIPADVDTAPSEAPADDEASGDNTLAYVIGGSGIVLLGGGVVLGFLGNAQNTKARNRCDGGISGCPAETKDPAELANSFATAGNVVGAIGVVGIGVGAILLLTGGSDEPAADSAWNGLSVSVDRGYAGLGFSGVLP
jgi:hypothetical protein